MTDRPAPDETPQTVAPSGNHGGRRARLAAWRGKQMLETHFFTERERKPISMLL